MKAIAPIAGALAIAASTGAVAGPPPADPRIGPEVSKVCFIGDINSWRALKGEDRAVLLEKGVHDWYRAEVSGSCYHDDFAFAEKIALASPTGGCLTVGDTIIVRGSAGGPTERCIITKLNKWDDKPKPAPKDNGE